MTCVLPVPALYKNTFSESGIDTQNNECERFDFNWINSQYPHSGLSDDQRRSVPCHTESDKSSLLSCRIEISNGSYDVIAQEQYNGFCGRGSLEKIRKECGPTNGNGDENNMFKMYNKTDPNNMNINNYGVKRRAEDTESEEVYIPSKRVSPFLNTPKERKDQRKKILKISIKKLKQFKDPEAFLRRTVLVNNTTKRLQKELRREKLRNKKRVSNKRRNFNGYGIIYNNCLSDTYLCEDPFLGGVHEKITDDMTDTLINNVLNDKSNDTTKESGLGGKPDIVTSEMEVLGEQQIIDSRILKPLNIIGENLDDTSIDSDTTLAQSNRCRLLTCLEKITCTDEICVDSCNEIEVENR